MNAVAISQTVSGRISSLLSAAHAVVLFETLYITFTRQQWQAVTQTKNQGGPIAPLIGAGKRLQSRAHNGNAPLILTRHYITALSGEHRPFQMATRERKDKKMRRKPGLNGALRL